MAETLRLSWKVWLELRKDIALRNILGLWEVKSKIQGGHTGALNVINSDISRYAKYGNS